MKVRINVVAVNRRSGDPEHDHVIITRPVEFPGIPGIGDVIWVTSGDDVEMRLFVRRREWHEDDPVVTLSCSAEP